MLFRGGSAALANGRPAVRGHLGSQRWGAESAGITATVPKLAEASGFLTGKSAADVTFPANDHRAGTYSPERARRITRQVAKLGFLADGNATVPGGAFGVRC
jgi:hypothetical protein